MTIETKQFEPSADLDEALEQAAERVGVQPFYWDIWGKKHVPAPEVTAAILKSLGVPSDSVESLNSWLKQAVTAEWSSLVAPTIVISELKPLIAVQQSGDATTARVSFEIQLESGGSVTWGATIAELEVDSKIDIDGQVYKRWMAPIPAELNVPIGYHRLKASSGDTVVEAHLLICPERAWMPESIEQGKKMAGLAVSLYGLRSDRNWGVGDTTDLERLSRWAADHLKVDFLALNPLHAIPNRIPYNTSPYLPTCIYFRNFLYLDIEALEDYRNCAAAQRIRAGLDGKLAEFRSKEFVDYEGIAQLKLRFLKLLYRQFKHELSAGSERAKAFRAYVAQAGDLLKTFATYCALDEQIHRSNRDIWIWPDWPAEYQTPGSQAVREFAERNWRSIEFYQYVQWCLDQAMEKAQRVAREAGMEIGLYHDLALATDRCGGDLWAHREYYVAGCRVGSPPDDFSPKGQDWSFPPPNKVKHRAEGYRLFADSIRNNCRHGGALRIDHVMRFFRLYWIPDGMEATNGAYVRDNARDLMHILALESVRNKVVVIGEDLGTVEPEIREGLASFGVFSYRLLWFEKDGDGQFKLPSDYPENALVSSTTHDLPTMAGFWTGRDIEARKQAGLVDEESYRQQVESRREEKQKLLDALHRLMLLPEYMPRLAEQIPELTGELHNAMTGFLVSTPSALMVLNQEDLTKETEQQNLPGSTAEYPNWRRKMRYSLEELDKNPVAVGSGIMFRNWLERSGRASS